ncbi:hypothetical protein GH5_02034 [Leishmania sp. Ghana 2012 LV757]|uniref:hypothetical protein n=1 Tax=Leishmania sp. Ghana 2012 LV757 TaxID=2803181 RepID=UPI001B661235|nr:hypothetical protein GH5_02034 [Leishmania sp. Ghana 2012 LV757]
MTASVNQRTRLFLVRSGSSGSGAPCSATAAKDIVFLELPSIPVATSNSTYGVERADALPRPLVSPVLHLGRQTPFLSSVLQNDRAWSRALLEVTTWCIEGLTSTACNGVVPVDAGALPFAGVRVRLCGKGHPIRVVPNVASGERGCITLTECGSCTWLQHGDVLEFGAQARVRLLAVHVRVGPAAELAQGASFLWVSSSLRTSAGAAGATVREVDAQPRMTAVPTALWFARIHEWSAVPKFLKSKMLLEAEQLTLHMHEEEARRHATVAAAMESLSESNRQGDGSTYSKCIGGTAARVAPSAENERHPPEGEALTTTSRQGSGAGRRSGTAADESEIDAATPTTRSQHQQQQLTLRVGCSPSNFTAERGQRRDASAPAGGVRLLPTALQCIDLEAAPSLSASSSQPRDCEQDAVPLHTAPQQTRSSGLHRPSCTSVRCTLATLSETIDERLNEALLCLENGGNAVSDALAQRFDKAVTLLGVVEEDLSGTHGSASEELKTSASQRTGCDDGGGENRSIEGDTPVRNQRLPKRGREKAVRDERLPSYGSRGVRTNARKNRRLSRGDGATSTEGTDLLKSLHDDPRGTPPAQHLTRADIRRMHCNQPRQEDSQVVFFDH